MSPPSSAQTSRLILFKKRYQVSIVVAIALGIAGMYFVFRMAFRDSGEKRAIAPPYEGAEMDPIALAYCRFSQERYPLPTESQVEEVEKRLGVRLPNDFRDFILEYNGGYFSDPRIGAPTDEWPLDSLCAIDGIGASDPDDELANDFIMRIFTDNDPPFLLPFSYTNNGNLLILSLKGEDRGAIYMQQAGTREWFLIANNIEEFFGLLRDSSECE